MFRRLFHFEPYQASRSSQYPSNVIGLLLPHVILSSNIESYLSRQFFIQFRILKLQKNLRWVRMKYLSLQTWFTVFSVIISMSWFIAVIIGSLPLMGWHTESYSIGCNYLDVTPKRYLLFIWITNYLLPNVSVIVMYSCIYCAIRRLVS